MAEATLEETESKFRDALSANVKRWRKLPMRSKCVAEFCALIESSSAGAERIPAKMLVWTNL